jgi:hypothetical protein
MKVSIELEELTERSTGDKLLGFTELRGLE